MAEKLERLINAAIKAANALPLGDPSRAAIETRVEALEGRFEALQGGVS